MKPYEEACDREERLTKERDEAIARAALAERERNACRDQFDRRVAAHIEEKRVLRTERDEALATCERLRGIIKTGGASYRAERSVLGVPGGIDGCAECAAMREAIGDYLEDDDEDRVDTYDGLMRALSGTAGRDLLERLAKLEAWYAEHTATKDAEVRR